MPAALNGLTSRPNWSCAVKNPSASQYYCKGRAVHSGAVYVQYILS